VGVGGGETPVAEEVLVGSEVTVGTRDWEPVGAD